MELEITKILKAVKPGIYSNKIKVRDQLEVFFHFFSVVFQFIYPSIFSLQID